MAVTVTSISPPRGRAGDTVVIAGTGFHATPGTNTVTFAGEAAVISGGTTTSLTVTVPSSGLGSDDLQKEVEVTNTGDATSASIYFFLMKSATDYITHRLQAQQPGTEEDPDTEAPTVAEAKDYERVAAYAETWMRDILPAAGGTSVPNTTSGAERIGVNPANFAEFTPARSTVQAALEAIDARIADVASGASAFVVYKGHQETGETQTATVPSTILADDLDNLVVDAFGVAGGGVVTLYVFGTAVVTNIGPNGAVFWMRANVIRTAEGACFVFAEFSNGANVAGVAVAASDGEIVAEALNGVVQVMIVIKHSAP